MLTNKKALLALSIASVLAMSGCSSDNDNNDPVVVDPVDPPVVVVPPEAGEDLSGVLTGSVVNQDYDVVSAMISFRENGEASTSLVDLDGNVVSSFDTSEGAFTLQLADDADATSVKAVLTAEGYANDTYVIDLSALADGNVSLQIPMTSLDTEGVAVETEKSAVTGGMSDEAITAGVDDGKANASVVVPAGVELQDADGNAIEGAEVTLTVLAADTSSAAGSVVTPEGLNTAGSAQVKTPVGVASVEMVDENGVKIKKFSSPITITMAIPADKMINGELIKTGDELDLVSQDEDTGEWTAEEQKVTVGALKGSFYNASFETSHLTFFAATVNNTTCASPITFTAGGADYGNAELTFIARSADASFEKTFTGTAGTLLSGEQVAEKGISADAQARVFVFDKDGNSLYDSTTEVAMCGEVNVALAEQEVEYVDEAFSISATCSNDDTVEAFAVTGAAVTYNRENKSPQFAAGNGEGAYALNNLISGESYNVAVTYKGDFASLGKQTYTVTADGEGESTEVAIECATTTGAN